MTDASRRNHADGPAAIECHPRANAAVDEGNNSCTSSPQSHPQDYSPATRQVRFSPNSMLFMYPEADDGAKRSMSCTSPERRSYMQNALAEAVRIKRKLHASNSDTDGPLNEHLASCGVPHEEIVGLEHLVLEDPRETIERRQAHMRVILTEQRSQKTTGECDDARLAQLSKILAKMPVSQARRRARAAMAA